MILKSRIARACPLLLCALVSSTALVALSHVPVRAQSVETDGDTSHVAPGDPNWNLGSSDLIIGQTGEGGLVILDGGTVTNGLGYVGDADGSSGTVLVSGPGSEWNNSEELRVGNAGTGDLIIKGGALVKNTRAEIGFEASGTGTVLVTGAGTRWDNSENLRVGGSGTGSLSIENGGVVTSKSDGSVGNVSGSVGSNASGTANNGTVLVTGAGSRWENAGRLVVSSGTLTIARGGQVTSVTSYVAYTGPVGGKSSVLVTDAGSRWNNSGDLDIGLARPGDLTVIDGGFVSADRLYIGNSTGTGIVTIAGGGVISVTGEVILTTASFGNATLNIGAAADEAAAAPGTLDAASVIFGNGTNGIVFNHTDISGNYIFAPVISDVIAISRNRGVAVYAGTTVLAGANTYRADTTIYGGTLKAGADNVFSSRSHHIVKAGGVLDFGGYDQYIETVTNEGEIVLSSLGAAVRGRALRSGVPGAVLRVNNYTGGGSLVLDTYLGGDNSPSDRLVIDSGVVSGSTLINIVNAAGPGADTTGNGIMVVETVNGGTAGAGSFMLGSRVAAGAYEYDLYYGGIDADGGDGNWYLRSVLPAEIVDPETGDVITVELPNYRVEIPLMAAVTPVAMEYGFSMLGTLDERGGDSRVAPIVRVYGEHAVRDHKGGRGIIRVPVMQAADRQQWFSGAWGRVIGDRGFQDHNHNFLRRGPDYSYNFAGIQTGFDVFAREQADGTLDKAGLYVGYGNIDSDVKGAWQGKAGTIDMDAWTVGGYWTHRAPQGWYTDVVVQGTWYQADAKSVEGQRLKPDGFGFLASLEGGYAFALGSELSLEPQAQIVYQNVSFDDVSDAYGRFTLGSGESIRGRFGLRLAKDWAAGEGASARPIRTWVRANVWHDFSGDASTTHAGFNGDIPLTVSPSLGGTWGEIGIGASGHVKENVSLFATGGYNRSLDNRGREAWNGRLGVAVTW